MADSIREEISTEELIQKITDSDDFLIIIQKGSNYKIMTKRPESMEDIVGELNSRIYGKSLAISRFNRIFNSVKNAFGKLKK
jgi:hypothetical protein